MNWPFRVVIRSPHHSTLICDITDSLRKLGNSVHHVAPPINNIVSHLQLQCHNCQEYGHTANYTSLVDSLDEMSHLYRFVKFLEVHASDKLLIKNCELPTLSSSPYEGQSYLQLYLGFRYINLSSSCVISIILQTPIQS